VVQNSIEVKNLGVATSAVTFFRSLGGTIGVSVLGSVLGTIVAQHIKDGIPLLGKADQAAAVATLGSGTIPHIALLPPAIRDLVEGAYGFGVGTVFLYSVPLAVITLIAVIFLPNAKLGTMNAVQLKNRVRDRTGSIRTTTGSIRTAASDATGSLVTTSDGHRRDVEAGEDALIGASAGTAALTPAGQSHPTGSVDVINPTTGAPVPDARR
jgi:hypothetical protein